MFHLWCNGEVNIKRGLCSDEHEVVMVTGASPRSIAHHIAILLHVHKVKVIGTMEDDHNLLVHLLPVEDGALDAHSFPSVNHLKI